MGKYIVKRILLLIPTIFIVCAIVFLLMRMVPGDAVDIIVNRMTQSGMVVDEAAVRARLGLDVPAFQQFFNWLWDVVRLDLGDSFFLNDSVSNIIGRQLPISLELGVITLILSNLISIPLGLYCAAHQDTISDYTVRIISVVLMAIPMFWLATMVLFYPSKWWGYAPPVQYISFFKDPLTNLQMFLVPAILGALAQAGIRLYAGCQGDADTRVAELLAGTLVSADAATCDHHHGEEHTCGDHGCGHHESGHTCGHC